MSQAVQREWRRWSSGSGYVKLQARGSPAWKGQSAAHLSIKATIPFPTGPQNLQLSWAIPTFPPFLSPKSVLPEAAGFPCPRAFVLLGTERCWPVHRARYRPGFGGEGEVASGLVLELCHPGPEKEGGTCGCSYRQNLDQPKMGPGDEAPHLKVNSTLCQTCSFGKR